MKKFTVLEAITVKPGNRFELTPEQLADRRYVVKEESKGSGVYVVVHETGFKAGEVITTDMEVPKALYGKLQPLEVAAEPAEEDGEAEYPEAATSGRKGRKGKAS